MAEKYVYSGAAGAGTGADWANAYTTMALAAAGCAAGDDIWVASDHAESTAAAITPAFPGTLAAPNRIVSVNRAGSVPPVAADELAGATITTTGASSITFTGIIDVHGLILNAGTGAVAASVVLGGSANRQSWEECQFRVVATSTSCRISLSGQTSCWTTLKNCKVKLANASQGVQVLGKTDWQNDDSHPAVDNTGTLPTTFVVSASSFSSNDWRGLDLSDFTAGKTLFGAALISKFNLIGCKLGASVTVAATPTTNYAQGVDLIGCSDTTRPYRNEQYLVRGTLTTETTIVRTGGAIGPDSTPVSWKVVTNSNASRQFPFTTFEVDIPNATTGSAKTLTFHCVTDNVTLTDAEIWLEVDYPGSALTPILFTGSDANATVLTTAANQTTSTATWTTTGLVTPVKQQIAVTFTPQMAGLIRARIKVAKASTTVYVCPLGVLS